LVGADGKRNKKRIRGRKRGRGGGLKKPKPKKKTPNTQKKKNSLLGHQDFKKEGREEKKSQNGWSTTKGERRKVDMGETKVTNQHTNSWETREEGTSSLGEEAMMVQKGKRLPKENRVQGPASSWTFGSGRRLWGGENFLSGSPAARRENDEGGKR